MQGLVNQPGTGVIPFQAARTTSNVQLLANVAANSYVYSNEAVQIWNVATPPVGIDQYTKLLLHGDGTNGSTTFTDSEILAKTVTRYGNAQISTAQSKFGGASMLFDGDTDSVGVSDSADFDVGSGDFTIDFWWRRGVIQLDEHICGQCDAAGTPASTSVLMMIASNELRLSVCSSTTTYSANSSGFSTDTSTWNHIAGVRNGNTLSIYLNGTSVGSTSVAGVTVNNSSNRWSIGTIGEYSNVLYSLHGYIDEFRFSKGIARWTANFTPPTQSYALPGIDSYTKLALHMDGADSSTTFTDSCAVPKTVTRYGDAQIKTAQSKFGGASGYFDGTGDVVGTSDSEDFNVGSEDFTVDFWSYPTAFGNFYMFGQADSVPNSSSVSFEATTGVTGIVYFYIFYSGGSYYLATSSLLQELNTWSHWAFIRGGTSIKIYKNGALAGTTSCGTTTVQNSANRFSVGGTGECTSGLYQGYIDEFRFSKGIARWTSNFTPPDRAYENQSSSGQLIPAISTATAASQLQVTTAGALNTYGATSKRYSGFVSKTEVGTI
jgi:hypothetical protein